MEMYSNEELYKEGSWLRKPIKNILDLIPYYEGYSNINVLDLGCGVGRNCIAIAKHYKDICSMDCVDILDFAIEKLYINAKEYGVESSINGIMCLVINSDVVEIDKKTNLEMSAQFEVNLQTDELISILNEIFKDWEVIVLTIISKCCIAYTWS